MEIKDLLEVCNALELSYRSYSGRGMYGKECFGIVTNDTERVILDIISEYSRISGVGMHDIRELCDMLSDSRRDSMGLSSIIYWPGIKWDKSFESEKDSDDEEEEFEE